MVKRAVYLGLTLIGLPSLLMAQTEATTPVFAGTWNVTATLTDDLTCTKATPGDVSAYVWIVSQTANGAISITVQGETTFPKLSGKWDSEKRMLVVSGSASGAFSKAAVWFKLTLNQKGELAGVRRFVSDSGGANSAPCFADFQVLARKQ